MENAFGILAWRFRVFSRLIELKPDTADKVIWAFFSLHNWLRKTSQNTYLPPQAVNREDFNTGNVTPGEWWENVNNLQSVHNLVSNNYKCVAEEVRRSYARKERGPGTKDKPNLAVAY